MPHTKNSFLIIDCDGTLVDTSDDILNSLNYALSTFNLQPYSREDIRKYIGTGIYPLIQEKADDGIFREVLDLFKDTYAKNLLQTSRIYPGWEQVLSEINKERTVILSNKPQQFLDDIVSQLALDRVCRAWFGREACSEHKPSPLPVQMILEKFSIPEKEAVIIGDMPSDIISGKSAGIKTVAVLYGYGNKEELAQHKPDATIEKPEDLIAALHMMVWSNE